MKRAAKLYHRMQLISNTTSVERTNSVVEERDDEVADTDQEAVLSEPEKSMEEKVSNQLVCTQFDKLPLSFFLSFFSLLCYLFSILEIFHSDVT